MLIQNTNPVSVAPDQDEVKRGFVREDLFVCVHEQFMTETARMADMVLPATMFLEHDDVYQAGGSQYILLGPKLIEPPGQCRSNHDVVCALARRVGAEHPGFAMSPRDLIDWTLQHSGWGTLEELERAALDRLPAGFRRRALPRRLRLSGRKIPFQAGRPNVPSVRAPMPRRAVWHAPTSGPLGGDRGGGRRASVPARHFAGARLPQLELHRDADLAREGRARR